MTRTLSEIGKDMEDAWDRIEEQKKRLKELRKEYDTRVTDIGVQK
jgi:hypothetical protein